MKSLNNMVGGAVTYDDRNGFDEIQLVEEAEQNPSRHRGFAVSSGVIELAKLRGPLGTKANAGRRAIIPT